MFGMLDISTSALVAQRTRLDAIAANLILPTMPTAMFGTRTSIP